MNWMNSLETIIFVLFGVFAVKVIDFFTHKRKIESSDERNYIEQFQEEFSALRERIAILEKRTEEQYATIVTLERENASLKEQKKFLEQTIENLVK